MAPGLLCMKSLKLFVAVEFTVPSTLRTSTGYRRGTVPAPGQGVLSTYTLPLMGQQVCVVSSASRRVAFCQYPPPVDPHPVSHGTQSDPCGPGSWGSAMFCTPVVIRCP